jgi:hypothetical protein
VIWKSWHEEREEFVSIARLVAFACLLFVIPSSSEAQEKNFPWSVKPFFPGWQWKEEVLIQPDSSLIRGSETFRTEIVSDTSVVLEEARHYFKYGYAKKANGRIEEIDLLGLKNCLGPDRDSVVEVRWSEKLFTSRTGFALLASALINASVTSTYAAIFNGKRYDPIVVGLILTGIEIPFYFPKKHRLVIPKTLPAK